MSEKIYEVPAEWKSARLYGRGEVPGNLRALAEGPERASGPMRRSASTGTGRRARSRTPPSAPGDVSIKWFEDGRTSARTASTGMAEARRPDRDHLGRRRPHGRRHITYGSSTRGVQFANVLRNRTARRATVSASTCRWCRKRRTRCSRARASVRSIRSCSAGSRRLACGRINDCSRTSSSRPTRACAAGKVPLKKNTDEALARTRRRTRHRVAAHRR